MSQASTMITTPVTVMVRATVWMRDGRLSNRTPNTGSCTTGRAPAPRAPMAIMTVPTAPNRRTRAMAASSPAARARPSDSPTGRRAGAATHGLDRPVQSIDDGDRRAVGKHRDILPSAS
jgi:hypothetical protein